MPLPAVSLELIICGNVKFKEVSRLIAAGISDKGKVRENNEDRYLIFNNGPVSLFAVADGMGGHAGGEVASTLTVETLKAYLSQNLSEGNIDIRSLLEDMLFSANRKVLETAAADTELVGMGTTLTTLVAAENQFWLGHIGDSRAYLINDDGISSLTEDHTLVTQLLRSGEISLEESVNHPQRNYLIRALGTEEDSVFDITQQNFLPGDFLLLCTDGLHGIIDNDEIYDTVMAGDKPEVVLGRLIGLANERGAKDNITAVLVGF